MDAKMASMASSGGLYLAYEWDDPGRVVRMMMRLWNPPFTPGEIATAWTMGTVRVEWLMTQVGHPSPYQMFRFLRSDNTVIFHRVQIGWTGNAMTAAEELGCIELHKQVRALLKS